MSCYRKIKHPPTLLTNQDQLFNNAAVYLCIRTNGEEEKQAAPTMQTRGFSLRHCCVNSWGLLCGEQREAGLFSPILRFVPVATLTLNLSESLRGHLATGAEFARSKLKHKRAHRHVLTHKDTHVWAHTSHLHAHTHTHMCINMCVHAQTHKDTRVWTHTHTCVRTHTQRHTHVDTHTYVQAHTLAQNLQSFLRKHGVSIC